MQSTQEEDELLVARLQHQLVQQLAQAGITQTGVLDAFRRVPRHAYVHEWYEREPAPSKQQRGAWRRYSRHGLGNERYLSLLYQDQPLVTRIDAHDAPASSSSQPSIMAEMLEALSLQPGHRVLEIGTGTGYHAALLAELVGEASLVTTIDIDPGLVEEAEAALRDQVSRGMTIITGDGLLGYVPHAPYDRMIATGSTPSIPLAWIEQLAPDGQLLCNLQRPLLNVIVLITKQGQRASGHMTQCRGMFMKLHTGSSPEPASRPRGLINPVIEKMTATSFHPANLFNKDFAFFLQLHLPFAMAYRMTKGEEALTYLYDPQSERVICFDRVHVRGSVSLWQELCMVALTFQQADTPRRSDYVFEISEDGHQAFRLGSRAFQIA